MGIRAWVRSAALWLRYRGDPSSVKGHEELRFWRQRIADEGSLGAGHYRYFFTDHFRLDEAAYAGRRLLDIGCGPRGSLDWADMTAARVGLDPLVPAYIELGIERHAMQYVGARAESMPFRDGCFDVVSSFNSLDHVDDLDAVVPEIVRVLAPGGTLLLLTDVNHDPTPTEPISFSWDILDRFAPALTVEEARRFEKSEDGVYQSVERARPYDDTDPTPRYGVLSARMRKLEGQGDGSTD